MKDIFRAILRSQTRLIFDYVDVFEVSHFSVEVKAVSDYEFGRNGESHVVGFEAGLGAFGLMEEGHESNGIGIVFFEVVDHLCCRQTRVDVSSMMTTSLPSISSVRPISCFTFPVEVRPL